MPQLVAVLDTSVVIFLSTSTAPEDRARFTRWRRVHSNAIRVFQRYSRVIIPTPVITELHAGGDDGVRIAMSLASQVKRLRVVSPIPKIRVASGEDRRAAPVKFTVDWAVSRRAS